MLRWKQVLGAIFVPLVVYAYSPVKEHVLDHYATRWYHDENPSERAARIRIRSLSSATSAITVRLGDSNSKIADFEYADPWNGPRLGYLSVARHSEALRQFDLSLKRPILVDEHVVSPSLEEIEDAVEAAALDRSVPKKHNTGDLLKEMTFSNHLLWLVQCGVRSPLAHPCCMERAWENWEYTLRGIQGDEVAFWKQVAGVQLGFSDFHFMPHGSTSLVLNLPAGHSSLLQVRYGFGPVHDDVDVATTEGPVLRVDKEEDLDLGDWLMFFLYPQRDDAYGAAIVVLALLTIPLWVPIKYLNTYTLVNRAVGRANQLDTAAEWDEVYSRIKFSLKDKFDSYRIILAKPASTIGSDALFDFVRASLVLAYQGGVGSFENERQLRMTINRSLLSLASI